MVCYGNHERYEGCQWEPLEPAADLPESTCHFSQEYPVDLYDKPIDTRPAPKALTPEQVREHTIYDCIKTLQENCDYFGVSLLRTLIART